MKIDKCKKLTKQQIKDEERAERKRRFYATVKWTPQVARMAQASLERSVHNRYVEFRERVGKKGSAIQYYSDTSSSSDSDDIARVCESPQKKGPVGNGADEDTSIIEEMLTTKAKQKFFPRPGSSLATKTNTVFAPDTMDIIPISGIDDNEGKRILENVTSHKS